VRGDDGEMIKLRDTFDIQFVCVNRNRTDVAEVFGVKPFGNFIGCYKL